VATIKLLLVFLAVVFFIKGGGPERAGSALLLFAFLCSVGLKQFGIYFNFYQYNPYHFAITILCFLSSLALAIFANRVWPLFFSALYLVESIGHLVVLVIRHGESRAYWAMTQLPTIGQLFVIALGTVFVLWRKRRGLRAPDWRDRAEI